MDNKLKVNMNEYLPLRDVVFNMRPEFFPDSKTSKLDFIHI